MKFNKLNLSTDMLATIKSIGYQTATKIQASVIPEGLKGRDIIGQAFTGTGKTAAFGIPIIEKTIKGGGFQHLILAPSRELANQIQKEMLSLSKHKDLKVAIIVGGISYNIQHKMMQEKPEIVIATPGRLMDIANKGWVNFKNIASLTLDEADEMLNFGFHKDILKINQLINKKVQTYFLTATFNEKIKQLAKDMLTNPFEVVISDGVNVSNSVIQKHIILKENEKLRVLWTLIHMLKPEGAVIFGRTRKRVKELSDALEYLKISAIGIHGDIVQKEREYAMSKFRDKKVQVLVATDVIARGIDVDHIDYVFNFDLPSELEYYTHRIGRTGRAGRTGISISFIKDNELPYYSLIQKTTNSTSTEMSKPSEKDLQAVKSNSLDNKLIELQAKFGDKFDRVGEKIAEKYDAKQLGIIIAKLLLGSEVNPFDITLNPEQSAGGNKKYRSQIKGKNHKPVTRSKGSRDHKRSRHKYNSKR